MPFWSDGCTATSAGGNPKISQPNSKGCFALLGQLPGSPSQFGSATNGPSPSPLETWPWSDGYKKTKSSGELLGRNVFIVTVRPLAEAGIVTPVLDTPFRQMRIRHRGTHELTLQDPCRRDQLAASGCS
jgi:hypothetical protein